MNRIVEYCGFINHIFLDRKLVQWNKDIDASNWRGNQNLIAHINLMWLTSIVHCWFYLSEVTCRYI